MRQIGCQDQLQSIFRLCNREVPCPTEIVLRLEKNLKTSMPKIKIENT